ncbi:MAG: PDZ domain-containing protein [Isosphaeraceae bacterium]
MRHTLAVATVIALALSGFVPRARAQVAVGPPSKLHLIIVADSIAPRVGGHLDQDRMALEHQFKIQVVESRLNVITLDARRLSPGAVLGAIERLPVGIQDTVYVHFACHGLMTDGGDQGFVFTASGNQILSREHVKQALRAKRTRLAILISDACYATPEYRPRVPWMPSLPTPLRLENSPLTQSLFFESAGFLDFSAVNKGEKAFCFRTQVVGGSRIFRGSIFTMAYVDTLMNNSEERSSWRSMLPEIERNTKISFREEFGGGFVVGRQLHATQSPTWYPPIPGEPVPERIAGIAMVPPRSHPVPPGFDTPAIPPASSPSPPSDPPPAATNPWAALGLDVEELSGTGLRVKRIAPGSFASRAGITPGSEIRELNRVSVKSKAHSDQILEEPLETLEVVWFDPNDEKLRLATIPRRTRRYRLSVLVNAYNPGVFLTRVDPGGAAERIGLAPRDVVLSVDGVATNSIPEFQKAIAESSGQVKLRFWQTQTQRYLERSVDLDPIP